MNRICLALMITSVLHSGFVVAGDTGSMATAHATAGGGIRALPGRLISGLPGAAVIGAEGDIEGCLFNRRVDLLLTIHSEI